MSIPIIFAGSRAPVWTPRNLFASGEQGAWYDPSDLSTLFQDAAGTTPVTAVEQPVGLMRDKSGRGNHATASADANRPTLKQDAAGAYYLEFNGTSSALATASIDLTATDKVTVFAGVRKLSDAGYQVIVNLAGDPFVNNGEFEVSCSGQPPGASNRYSYTAVTRGSTLNAYVGGYAYQAPHSAVISTALNNGASGVYNQIALRVNGATPSTLYNDGNTTSPGNFLNGVLTVGARTGPSTWFSGRLYSLIVRGAATSAADIVRAESYVNLKSGRVY